MPGNKVDNPHESAPKAVCVIHSVYVVKELKKKVFTHHGAKAEYAVRMAADQVVLLGVQVCSLHQRYRVICGVQFPHTP